MRLTIGGEGAVEQVLTGLHPQLPGRLMLVLPRGHLQECDRELAVPRVPRLRRLAARQHGRQRLPLQRWLCAGGVGHLCAVCGRKLSRLAS